MNNNIVLEEGSKRVKSSDFKQYTKQNGRWLLSDDMSEETYEAVQHYLRERNVEALIDKDIDKFLKGHISACGNPSGKRINELPNGKKLARGGFSLFAKNLKFNLDGKSDWAVMYENYSGLKTYLYDEENVHLEREKKRKLVNKFIRFYPLIVERLERDLKLKRDIRHLALHIMIMTKIRVGNLEYLLHYGHKGLTTLQKRDITIKGNIIIFDFVGKDGVPQHVEKEFDTMTVRMLQKLLDKKQEGDFVFTGSNDLPLHGSVFSKILFKYTGEHFYPHIIRSFYADSKCRKFIRNHRSPTRKQVLGKFKEIAANLGHKKYDPKKKDWVADYKITISNYIRPEYVEKMKEMCK